MDPILEITDLKTHFPIKKGLMKRTVNYVRAVNGVSFKLKKGETLGIVGESGCGKTTLGRSILHLVKPTGGKIVFNGWNLGELTDSELNKKRTHMQMIFQNPMSSLNPRMTVKEILTDALLYHKLIDKKDARQIAAELLEKVGMNQKQLERFPHEFSGGQRQRLCIARALSLNPELIVCDESVSALDVSIQAQILNLLKDIQREYKMSYLFISHDLGVIKFSADRIAVMYLGKIVEIAEKNPLFDNPKHPYTKLLLSSIPASHPDKRKSRRLIAGDVPNPTKIYEGCSFMSRCPEAEPICKTKQPEKQSGENGHYVWCHKATM